MAVILTDQLNNLNWMKLYYKHSGAAENSNVTILLCDSIIVALPMYHDVSKNFLFKSKQFIVF